MSKWVFFNVIGLITVLAIIPYFVHQEFTAQQAVVCKCICFKCQSSAKDAVKYQDRSGKLSELNGVGDEPSITCQHKWRSGCIYGSGCLVVHQRPRQTCELCQTERDRPEFDKQATNEWEQGEFVTLRKVYPHQGCDGHLVFNGQAKPAPYSEKEFFYTHVCDLCGATNQILNATWPQYKQEWRAK